MKKIIIGITAFSLSNILYAQSGYNDDMYSTQPSKFSYSFDSDPKWHYYSNAFNSCKLKDGQYLLSNSGKRNVTEFSTDTHYSDFKNLEISGVFTPVKTDEASTYGLVAGYQGHRKYKYGDVPTGKEKYYHIFLEINKNKKTYSIYDFSLSGDQYIFDGIPNYFIKDQVSSEIKDIGNSDLLAIYRGEGNWKFFINSKVVYEKPDTSTEYNSSVAITVRNKTTISVDDMEFNYIPGRGSKLFTGPEAPTPIEKSITPKVSTIEYDVLIPFRGSNKKDGYKTPSGQIIVQPKYDYGAEFTDELALVRDKGLFGFIDKTGREIIPLQYESAGGLYEGLAIVKSKGKYGFIDKTGKIIIPITFEFANDFSEDFAAVMMDGKWEFIDKIGKTVIPFKFIWADNFINGNAPVTLDGKAGTINKTGIFSPK